MTRPPPISWRRFSINCGSALALATAVVTRVSLRSLAYYVEEPLARAREIAPLQQTRPRLGLLQGARHHCLHHRSTVEARLYGKLSQIHVVEITPERLVVVVGVPIEHESIVRLQSFI